TLEPLDLEQRLRDVGVAALELFGEGQKRFQRAAGVGLDPGKTGSYVTRAARHSATLVASAQSSTAGITAIPARATFATTITSAPAAPTHASQRPKTAVRTMSHDMVAIATAAASRPPAPSAA